MFWLFWARLSFSSRVIGSKFGQHGARVSRALWDKVLRTRRLCVLKKPVFHAHVLFKSLHFLFCWSWKVIKMYNFMIATVVLDNLRFSQRSLRDWTKCFGGWRKPVDHKLYGTLSQAEGAALLVFRIVCLCFVAWWCSDMKPWCEVSSEVMERVSV